MSPFPEGMVVYLKTGSPPLTVEAIRNDDCISVVWFVGGDVKRDAFHKDALIIDDPFNPKIAATAPQVTVGMSENGIG